METRDVLSLSLNAPLVGRFDLEAGTASISEPDFGPLLFDPSSGTLPVLILSSSPDSIWQLIQVGSLASDGQYNGGIWLVSREFQIRLTEAPYRAYGEWAADNSLLWFEYSLPEFGAGSRIIHLDETPPRIIDPEGGESIPTPLDPTYYLTAFSPVDKTLLSLRIPVEWEEMQSDVYVFDLSQAMTVPIAVETIPGVVRVFWNKATASFLLVILGEETVEIRKWDRSLSVNFPISSFGEEIPEWVTRYNIPTAGYALSPSGGRLAINFGDDRIFLFDCH